MRNPDVNEEAVLTQRTLGVPHVHTDKVAVRSVDVLNARIAHRRRFERICVQCAETRGSATSKFKHVFSVVKYLNTEIFKYYLNTLTSI